MRATDEDHGSLEEQLAELRAQLGELADKEAIRERLNRYVFLLDAAMWRDIPEEIFTEDGVDFHMPDADPPSVQRGRQELLEFFEEVMPASAGTQHFLGNPSIEVDGDEARSRAYVLASHWNADVSGEDPRPAERTIAGAYEDSWRRTDVGWRVYERHVHVFGPRGLLRGEMAAADPPIGTDRFGHRDRHRAR